MSNCNLLNNSFYPSQGEKLWSKTKQNITLYKEFLPCRELQPYIACYWISKVIAIPNEAVTSRIIPDGCMDIVFDIGSLAKGRGAMVVGTMLSTEENGITDLREFIGVRFWPGAIVPFIKNSARDFTEKTIPLEHVWGSEDSILSERIYNATSIYGRIRILEETLKKRLRVKAVKDSLIENMLYKVYRSRGNISIKDLAIELNVSQRHLSRKANQWLGINTKAFNSIIRFQNIINELNAKPKANLMDIVYKNGYYDQAHFTKEFKSLYGKTPSQLKID